MHNQVTLSEVLWPLISGVIGVSVGAFLNNFLIAKREKQSLQRLKAAQIADLFAKWIKYGGRDKEELNRMQLFDHYEELHKATFELVLWCKDEKLLKKIMERLAHKEEAQDVKQLLMETRTLILTKPASELKADDIVDFRVS